MQPLLCQKGKLLIIQEDQTVTRGLQKSVCSFISAASLCSTQRCSFPESSEFGTAPLDAGLTALTRLIQWAA